MSRKLAGFRIIQWSILFGLLSYTPLQLYIWFGPEDGNPIGLGLLAVFGIPAAGVGIVCGIGKLVMDYVRVGE